MGGSRMAVAFLALGGLVGGCATEAGMDLAKNPTLYRDTGYETTLPPDRNVFVMPVVDDREPRVQEASGQFSVSYFSDGDWKRPPAVMIDEVVRREVAESGVFRSVEKSAHPDDCLLRVTIKRFDVGAESHVEGWKSFAAVVLNVKVLGPVGPGGDRAVLLDREVGGAQKSAISWVPPAATGLTGLSLRQAVSQMLAAIDQSNAARANVPLEQPDK